MGKTLGQIIRENTTWEQRKILGALTYQSVFLMECASQGINPTFRRFEKWLREEYKKAAAPATSNKPERSE